MRDALIILLVILLVLPPLAGIRRVRRVLDRAAAERRDPESSE